MFIFYVLFGISITFNFILILLFYKVKDDINFNKLIVDKKAYNDFYLDKVIDNLEKEGSKFDDKKENID